jgi:O-antigen ligase
MVAASRGFTDGVYQDRLVVAAVAVMAPVLGWSIVKMPAVALLPVAAIGVLPLLVSARARVLFVVFGAIFAFGTTDELTLSKLAYLMGLGAAGVGALVSLYTLTRTPAFAALRPLVYASVSLTVLVVMSLPVAQLQGASVRDWLRDSAAYVMAAMVPLFALDAYSAFSKRALERILVVAGLLGALSFAVNWLARRGIGTLGLDVLGLPTTLLAASLFAYAMSALMHGGQRRTFWLVTGVLTFALLISTGTRTTLILLAAPLAIVFGSSQRVASRSLRLVVILPLVVVLVGLAAQSVLRLADAEDDVIQSRIELLFASGSQRDSSYIERVNSTRVVWDAFRSAPLLGVAPGTYFTWDDSAGIPKTGRSVDSPILFLARFGLVGLAWVVIFAVAYLALIRHLARVDGAPTVSRLALVGFGGILLADTILLVPFEDKGFSAALLLLVALALRETFGPPRVPAAR